jgi:hypothetical protein
VLILTAAGDSMTGIAGTRRRRRRLTSRNRSRSGESRGARARTCCGRGSESAPTADCTSGQLAFDATARPCGCRGVDLDLTARELGRCSKRCCGGPRALTSKEQLFESLVHVGQRRQSVSRSRSTSAVLRKKLEPAGVRDPDVPRTLAIARGEWPLIPRLRVCRRTCCGGWACWSRSSCCSARQSPSRSRAFRVQCLRPVAVRLRVDACDTDQGLDRPDATRLAAKRRRDVRVRRR